MFLPDKRKKIRAWLVRYNMQYTISLQYKENITFEVKQYKII